MERGKVSAESVEQSKASSSAPPPPLPPWIELPPEITADILQRLGVVEILDSAQKVCTTWWNASKDPGIWKTINMSLEKDVHTYSQKEMMSRQAVERSQGQVVDIQITNLDAQSTDLIGYIAEQCSQLTRLSLHFISVKPPINCVTEAVRKLVLLEKLQVEFVRALFTHCCDLIETAGKSCPALKSFTLSKKRRAAPSNYDEVALAVAEWMPELRHLGLEQDSLTKDGLTAILDGCKYLESLHLCGCSKLRIEGELARRCSQQIRDLRIEDADSSRSQSSGDDFWTRRDDYDADRLFDWYEYDHDDSLTWRYDPDSRLSGPSDDEPDYNWWDNDDY